MVQCALERHLCGTTQKIKQILEGISSVIFPNSVRFLSGEPKTRRRVFFRSSYKVYPRKYGVVGLVGYAQPRIMRLCSLYIHCIIFLCFVGDTTRYTECVVPSSHIYLLNMSSVDYYFVSFTLIISSWLISKQRVWLPAQIFLTPQFCTLQTETSCSNRSLTHLSAVKILYSVCVLYFSGRKRGWEHTRSKGAIPGCPITCLVGCHLSYYSSGTYLIPFVYHNKNSC